MSSQCRNALCFPLSLSGRGRLSRAHLSRGTLDADVPDVWAKYGESRSKEGYDQLRRVTHWSQEDVEREIALKERDVNPAFVIGEFRQLVDQFQFQRTAAER